MRREMCFEPAMLLRVCDCARGEITGSNKLMGVTQKKQRASERQQSLSVRPRRALSWLGYAVHSTALTRRLLRQRVGVRVRMRVRVNARGGGGRRMRVSGVGNLVARRPADRRAAHRCAPSLRLLHPHGPPAWH